MVADYEGHALTYNGSSWSAPADIDGSEGVGSVACPSSSFCVATDAHGNVMIYAEHEASSGGGGGGSGGGGSTSASGSAPNITTPPTGVVALSTTTIAAKVNGTASVSLHCTGTATCKGALELAVNGGPARKQARAAAKAKTTVIGKTKFSIAAGKTAIVRVKLNATGRALLKAHHGKLTATLTVKNSSPSPAATSHKTVHIVQKGAK